MKTVASSALKELSFPTFLSYISPFLSSSSPSSSSVMDQMLGWVARPEVLPSPLRALM